MTKTIEKVKRPTGLKAADYGKFEKWTFRRWAWEFLRRNDDFAKRCRAAGEDLAARQAVADDFGLKRFKSFAEGYSKGSKPRFSDDAICSWTWQEGQDRQARIRIERGQVLIRFDLSTTTNDSAVLDAQLRAAKSRLNKRQAAYLKEMALPEPKEHKKKPVYFLQSLRLLDLMAYGKKHDITIAQAWMILHKKMTPVEARKNADAAASQDVANRSELAREMASTGYRYLASRPGRPSVEKFACAD